MTSRPTLSLLIAEDDQIIRYLIETAAARAGGFGPIVCVPDGQAALDAIRTGGVGNAPDLIVSDLSMPRMTGIELIRALKQDPATRSIPIAIVTSSDMPHDRKDAFEAGACAFVPKPHGFEALIELLASLRDSCCAMAETERPG
jgi:CheY-like chemotaxis protein